MDLKCIKDLIKMRKIEVNNLLSKLDDINEGGIAKGMKNDVKVKRVDYSIIKELNTKLYVMCFENIMVFRANDIEYLKRVYNDGKYKFIVYERENEYYVFNICDSKITNIFSKCFSDIKYYHLYKIYGPFIPINKGCNEDGTIYRFYNYIGEGEVNKDLESLVKLSIKVANIYLKQTPEHYMNI